jgi:hypothetical protein
MGNDEDSSGQLVQNQSDREYAKRAKERWQRVEIVDVARKDNARSRHGKGGNARIDRRRVADLPERHPRQQLLQHNPAVQIGAAESLDWSCTYTVTIRGCSCHGKDLTLSAPMRYVCGKRWIPGKWLQLSRWLRPPATRVEQ